MLEIKQYVPLHLNKLVLVGSQSIYRSWTDTSQVLICQLLKLKEQESF